MRTIAAACAVRAVLLSRCMACACGPAVTSARALARSASASRSLRFQIPATGRRASYTRPGGTWPACPVTRAP
jgi:hypothetical protein